MLDQKEELKKLFNLSYGENIPSKQEWKSFYRKEIRFTSPTQE